MKKILKSLAAIAFLLTTGAGCLSSTADQITLTVNAPEKAIIGQVIPIDYTVEVEGEITDNTDYKIILTLGAEDKGRIVIAEEEFNNESTNNTIDWQVVDNAKIGDQNIEISIAEVDEKEYRDIITASTPITIADKLEGITVDLEASDTTFNYGDTIEITYSATNTTTETYKDQFQLDLFYREKGNTTELYPLETKVIDLIPGETTTNTIEYNIDGVPDNNFSYELGVVLSTKDRFDLEGHASKFLDFKFEL